MTKTKNVVRKTNSFGARDMANSANGIPLQEIADTGSCEITVTAAALIEDVDEDGSIREATCLVTEDKQYYTSISNSIYNSAGFIIDIIEDEGKANVRIEKRRAKSGRDFLVAIVL